MIDVLFRIQDSIVALDNNFIITYANQAFEDTVGFKVSEMLGKNIWTIMPRVVETVAYKEILEAMAKKQVRHFEWKGVYSKPFLETTIFPSDKGVTIISRDITERKQAEELLRKSQEELKAIISNAPIGIAISDSNKVFINSNMSFCRILGFSEDELRSLTFKDITHPNDVKESLALMEQLTSGCISFFSQEKRYIRKDKKIINGKITVSAIRDKEGKPALFIAELEDITERKKAEEKLKEDELKFRTVADFAYDWEYWVAPDGKLLYVSPSCERITGYLPDDFINDSTLIKKIVHPEDARFKEHLETIDTNNSYEDTFRIVTRSGAVRWVEHFCRPVFDFGGTFLGRRISNRDVTDRKQTEEAVHRQAALIDLSPDAIMVRALDGTISFWSNGAEKLYGYSKQEALGKISHGLLKTQFPMSLNDIDLQIKNVGSWSGELIHKTKAGQTVVVQSCWLVERTSQGEVEDILESNIDITERKNAEEALKESERLYKTLFDNSEDGFILVEPIFDKADEAIDFRFLKVNLAYERQTGIRAVKVVGKRAKEIVPELEQEWVAACGNVTKTDKHIFYESFNQRTKRWYDAHYFPYAKGQVGILFRDITKRKEAEKSLLESEAKYEQLVERLPEMVLEIDTNGRVIFANSRVSELLGYSKEELENGFDANRFVVPEDDERSKQNMKKSFAGEMRRSNEYIFVRKDGTPIPVLLNSVPIIKDNKVAGIRGIIIDMTERKKLEKQLQEQQRMATIGQTAGMVGHDLRNPLQTIISELYLAKSELTEIPENPMKNKMLESIQSLAEQVSYMDKIVSDLQTFIKPVNAHKQIVSLEPLIAMVLAQTDIPKNIQASMQVEDNLSVNADPQLLKRVLINLVTNALQAMPQGGELTIKAQSNAAGQVQTVVEDTGEGIPDEIKSKIFEPLFTTKSKGQGFGLAVCKRVIEAQGGTITFESEVGKGTKFIIELSV